MGLKRVELIFDELVSENKVQYLMCKSLIHNDHETGPRRVVSLRREVSVASIVCESR